MTNTNATNFRKNAFEYFSQAVRYNDIINVTTKDGNAVVMSEDDYNGIMETLYIMSHPATAKEILDGMKEPAENGIVYDPKEEW